MAPEQLAEASREAAAVTVGSAPPTRFLSPRQLRAQLLPQDQRRALSPRGVMPQPLFRKARLRM